MNNLCVSLLMGRWKLQSMTQPMEQQVSEQKHKGSKANIKVINDKGFQMRLWQLWSNKATKANESL